MSGMLFKRRENGYTMMEMMMALAVVAILSFIAVPSFKYVTSSNRVATEVNGLLGDMLFARSEAVKEGATVTVCISSDGATCLGNGAGGAWQLGWIVFLDTNGNQKVDAGEAVVRVQPAFSGTDTFLGPATFNAISFNRLGYAPTGVWNTISLHDSTNNTAWIRCLAISPIGSATTERNGFSTPPAPACT
jgi:type IV fimbrial biogenesis protein FimT